MQIVCAPRLGSEILAWLGANLILISSYFYIMNKTKKRNTSLH